MRKFLDRLVLTIAILYGFWMGTTGIGFWTMIICTSIALIIAVVSDWMLAFWSEKRKSV